MMDKYVCICYICTLYILSIGEPHSIIVIIFVIFTAGVGWVLYKYLTKTKGMYILTQSITMCNCCDLYAIILFTYNKPFKHAQNL